MIFYFSATGNSLYIAKELEEKPISIAQELKKNNLHYQADTIGIVVPDYGSELPQIVRRFLENATFETNYLYMIITYGKNQSVVTEWSYYFAKSHHVHFDYIRTLLMVDNYLPVFDMDEEKKIDKHIDEQLEIIQQDIQNKVHYIERPIDEAARELYERASRRPIEANNGSAIEIDDHKCIGCGMCTLVCPIGNFYLKDGKAQRYANTCEFCLACAHHCSKKAITTKIDKNTNARYINPNIKISEIIQANQQR